MRHCKALACVAGAYSKYFCLSVSWHSCKTQTALLAHFFLPFLGSGFGGADDFRFAPRAAAGFDDEDNLWLVPIHSDTLILKTSNGAPCCSQRPPPRSLRPWPMILV